MRLSPRESPYRALGLLMECRSWAIEGNRARTMATGSQVLEASRSVHPSFLRLSEFYAEVARAYVLVGALAEAEQVVSEGQGIFLQDPVLIAVRATLHVERRELKEAWEIYERAAKLPVTGPDWRQIWGHSKVEVGQRAAALPDFEVALAGASLEPYRWMALSSRCEQRVELGALEAAAGDLAVLAAGPPSWKVGELKARLALGRGELDAARHELELALRLSPGRSELSLLEARLAWRGSRFEEALAAVERVLAGGARVSLRARALALKAFLLARLARPTQARSTAKLALSLLAAPEEDLRARLQGLRANPENFAKEK